MQEKFLKLTNIVYSILAYLPESDPLKGRAKEKALVVMDNLSLFFGTSGWASFQKDKIQNQLLDDINMLLNYLRLAKMQGWISSMNYIIISNEYEKIKEKITLSSDLTKKATIIAKPILQERTQITPDSVLNSTGAPEKEEAPESLILADSNEYSNLSERQKKIIKFLKENEKAQVMDLQSILPKITKRTIRRDLDELLKIGKIVRLGSFNQIFYKISDF